MRLLPLALLLSCQPAEPRLTLVVPADQQAIFEAFVEPIPYERLAVVTDEGDAKGIRITVVPDLDCTDCYRVDGGGRRFEVHGDAPLGVQYGVAHLLEAMGFRFFHPYSTRVPRRLTPVGDDHALIGTLHEPDIARRGLHLHTLHPIEGLDAMWTPGEQTLAEALQIVDWTVKNRGNHLQWVALDDIIRSEETHAAWKEHTTAIVEAAHTRGLTTGLGIQLFGSGNLQQAFDLLDSVKGDERDDAAIAERLALLEGIGFDVYNLSFGEFFGEEPDAFLAAADRAVEAMQAQNPEIDIPVVIHVGNYEDLRVTWEGEEMQYYFLAQFIEGATPWVHTTMYYNLYEDAGGAYLHDEFDEHRAFLLDRLAAGEPVGYFPESAYWIAFDNSVPQYLPLYVRSRWVDLARTAEEVGPGVLDDHVLFSTGWEWGYWQNDYATLRMSYALPDDYGDLFEEMFAPYDDPEVAGAVIDLTDAQHTAHIEQRLAPFLASRDSVIDFGDEQMGILSQPDRPSFEEVVAMGDAEREALADAIIDPLADLATATAAAEARLQGSKWKMDPWVVEILDGMAVGRLRAQFARAVYGAAIAHGKGEDASSWLIEAKGLLDEARQVVATRHAALHDPDGGRWIDASWDNPTVYDYGYLLRADELCFWERELGQVWNLVEGTSDEVPACAL